MSRWLMWWMGAFGLVLLYLVALYCLQVKKWKFPMRLTTDPIDEYVWRPHNDPRTTLEEIRKSLLAYKYNFAVEGESVEGLQWRFNKYAPVYIEWLVDELESLYLLAYARENNG